MVEALADAVRADQRHLGRRLRDAGDELVFLERHVARELEPRLDRPAVRDRRALLVQRHLPAPQRGAAFDPPLVGLQRRAAGVVALDRGAEAVLEVEPAHLAVADDVEADALLQPHRARAPRRPRSRAASSASSWPSSKRLRASITAAGRSRLPTTSVRMVRRSVIGQLRSMDPRISESCTYLAGRRRAPSSRRRTRL